MNSVGLCNSKTSNAQPHTTNSFSLRESASLTAQLRHDSIPIPHRPHRHENIYGSVGDCSGRPSVHHFPTADRRAIRKLDMATAPNRQVAQPFDKLLYPHNGLTEGNFFVGRHESASIWEKLFIEDDYIHPQAGAWTCFPRPTSQKPGPIIAPRPLRFDLARAALDWEPTLTYPSGRRLQAPGAPKMAYSELPLARPTPAFGGSFQTYPSFIPPPCMPTTLDAPQRLSGSSHFGGAALQSIALHDPVAYVMHHIRTRPRQRHLHPTKAHLLKILCSRRS